VAEKHINKWTIGQANIEIDNVEPTLPLYFMLVGQLVGAGNRNGRDVYSPHREAAAGEPNRADAGTARNIERSSGSREEMFHAAERVGRILDVG
jgi:hypothetical protein